MWSTHEFLWNWGLTVLATVLAIVKLQDVDLVIVVMLWVAAVVMVWWGPHWFGQQDLRLLETLLFGIQVGLVWIHHGPYLGTFVGVVAGMAVWHDALFTRQAPLPVQGRSTRRRTK